jgi:hypothetical protein
MKYVKQYKFPIVFLISILLSVTGCTVKYVADYDASIKEEIFQVANKVDFFWGTLLDTQVTDRKYDKFKDQYNQIESDIRGLVMKNEVRALNKESTKQANIALKLWIEDKSIHKGNDNFSDFEAKRHRKQFIRVFTAMAKGEDAKNITVYYRLFS